MRALVLEDFGRLAVHDVAAAAEPGPDEVRVRISYTGICGSDLHGYTGENGRRVPGQVMGHETVGRIESLGELAAGRRLEVGQVVTFNPLLSCGRCAACEQALEQHCPNKRVVGVTPELVAAFAELVTVPAANVVPLAGPDQDAAAAARTEPHGALVEPLAVSLHAARRAGIGEGQAVLVTGGGPIGQSAVLAALRLGASRVLATDLSGPRRDLCAALGAEALDPAAGPVPEQVQQALGGPADAAIDAVGVTASLADALHATRLGGTVSLVGMGSPDVQLPAYQVSTAERTLVGSFAYDAATFRETVAWVAEGDPVLDTLISQTVPLTGAAEAFAALARSADIPGKVLVDLR